MFEHTTKYTLLSLALVCGLTACQSQGESETFGPATQPDEAEIADGKADRLNSSIVTETTDESLRSNTLRRTACDAVPDIVKVSSLRNDCTDQDFTVKTYYSNEDILYRGSPMLVAMDVEITTEEKSSYLVRLVRYYDQTTLNSSWSALFLEQTGSPSPDIAKLEELIREGGAYPDYNYIENFEEIDFDALPDKVKRYEDESRDAIAEGLAEDYENDYYIELSFVYAIKDDSGTTIGWAYSYALSYGNGDGGATYYFDLEGNYVDDYRYYA